MTAQDVWDELDDRLQQKWRGNTDPWAGPVDPAAVERELQAWRRRQSRVSWREVAENTCGCWAIDCAECGPRRADGQRPPAGHVRAWSLRQDAALQAAKIIGGDW